jgi:hypothetical protein
MISPIWVGKYNQDILFSSKISFKKSAFCIFAKTLILN